MATYRADTILHPVRMRIITALSGRRLTTRQIAAALPDVAQATLYRHIGALARARIVAVAEERRARGATEKAYALANESGGAPLTADISAFTTADWQRGFAAYAASLVGQFEAYIRQPGIDPTADHVTFRTGAVYLSDAELEQLSRVFQTALAPLLANAPSPGRRRLLLSNVLIPDLDPDPAALPPDLETTYE